MKTISLMSAKEGSSKTTTSINIAVGLSETNRVLLIDLDPQGNSSKRFFQNYLELDGMDELLFLSIKNDLGNRVFYRSPSVLPAPDSKAQAIGVIINEESMWDLALEEYLMNRCTRGTVHHHEGQME